MAHGIQDVQLVQGYAYRGEWALVFPEPYEDAWPDVVGARAQFVMKEHEGADKFLASAALSETQVAVQLGSLVTSDLVVGRIYDYRVTADLKDGGIATLIKGRIRVRPVEDSSRR